MKILFCILINLVIFPALADETAEPNHAAIKRAINLAPNVILQYSIKAKQRGIPIGGESSWHWRSNQQNNPATYFVSNEVRASLFGKIQETQSEGVIDEYGLAPRQFTEKRFRKDPTSTRFDPETRQISFTDSARNYALQGGEQDRSSVIWQLIATARANPKQFVAGSQWSFFVAGRRDAEPWVFKVLQQESIATPMGKLNSWHLIKMPPPDSKDQQLDIWLGQNLDWYPLRLRFMDADGDFVDQTLEKIEKQ